MNGDNFVLGQVLGGLQQSQERLIYVAELHGQSLARLADVQTAMAASLARIEAKPPSCPHPKPPGGTDHLTWRDRLQLAAFAVALVAAMAGKLPWRDAVLMFGKPFGF